MDLRPAQLSDSEAILAIYNAEVTESVNTFDIEPRTIEEQRKWLVDHQGAYPCLVVTECRATPGPEARATPTDHPPTIVGFGSLSRFRDRPAYATTVEDSVYVDRAWRGHGIGGKLLDALIDRAVDHGFHTVVARIVGHNETSIGLHIRCGFTLVGVEREVGRKHGQWLDVVELQRML